MKTSPDGTLIRGDLTREDVVDRLIDAIDNESTLNVLYLSDRSGEERAVTVAPFAFLDDDKVRVWCISDERYYTFFIDNITIFDTPTTTTAEVDDEAAKVLPTPTQMRQHQKGSEPLAAMETLIAQLGTFDAIPQRGGIRVLWGTGQVQNTVWRPTLIAALIAAAAHR
jgi:predicted DNA-binding transcriptional regulator YafY